MACDNDCRVSRLKSEQKRALVEEAGACENCGEDEKLEVDHRIPVSRGGCHCLQNMWVLCRNCNRFKYTMTVNEFEDSGLAKWLRKQAHLRWLAWIDEEQRKNDQRLRQSTMYS